MLGIKTKKDKKIEKLQKEIDRLKTMLISPKITYQTNDTSTLYSEYTVPFGAQDVITEKHIKRVLASKMLEVVEENLEIEANDDMLRNLIIYRAKLEVIKRSE